MTTQAPQFCSDCFKGTLRGDIEPTGTVETINGLPTYVARPEAGKEPTGIVVIIPDAIGWELRNTRGLADSYARRIPAVVLVPEFMDGHAPPGEFLMAGDRLMDPKNGWLYKNLVLRPLWFFQVVRHFIPLAIAVRPAIAKPRIYGYIKGLRTSPIAPFSKETLKIGAAGFCWGGKYAITLTHDAEADRVPRTEGGEPLPLVDCAFTGHPSFVTLPDDIENVKVPLSVANGDQDMMMAGEKMVLCKKILDGKEGCEAVVYPGAIHGFSVRGDPNDKRQAEFGMKAEDQAVAWFRKHFEST